MISYAQNYEDVYLNRVFKEKRDGFYIDIGAWHPETESVTKHFYDQGWHGINVEPIEKNIKRFLKDRPRDINIQGAVGDTNGTVFFKEHQEGLSTLNANVSKRLEDDGYKTFRDFEVEMITLESLCEKHVGDREIDFLKIDVEGAERKILEGANLTKYRPTIILLEAIDLVTKQQNHQEWEELLLKNDYLDVFFDGLNRYYIFKEKEEIKKHFLLPVNINDDFIRFKCIKPDGPIMKRLKLLVKRLRGIRQ